MNRINIDAFRATVDLELLRERGRAKDDLDELVQNFRCADGSSFQGFISWDTFRIWHSCKVLGWQPVSCEGKFEEDGRVRIRFFIGVYPMVALWVVAALLLSLSVGSILSGVTWHRVFVSLASSAIVAVAVCRAVQRKQILEREIRRAISGE